MWSITILALVLYTIILSSAFEEGSLWCGKAYTTDAIARDPGGKFIATTHSHVCYARYSFYTKEEYAEIEIDLPRSILQPRRVAITGQGINVVVDIMDPGLCAVAKIPIYHLEALLRPHRLQCLLYYSYSAPALAELYLHKLPDRQGSLVKVDRRTAAVLVRAAPMVNTTSLDSWQKILPFGYFQNWGGWLSRDINHLVRIKEAGYNIIHPVPSAGGSLEIAFGPEFDRFVEKAADLGCMLSL